MVCCYRDVPVLPASQCDRCRERGRQSYLLKKGEKTDGKAGEEGGASGGIPSRAPATAAGHCSLHKPKLSAAAKGGGSGGGGGGLIGSGPHSAAPPPPASADGLSLLASM